MEASSVQSLATPFSRKPVGVKTGSEWWTEEKLYPLLSWYGRIFSYYSTFGRELPKPLTLFHPANVSESFESHVGMGTYCSNVVPKYHKCYNISEKLLMASASFIRTYKNPTSELLWVKQNNCPICEFTYIETTYQCGWHLGLKVPQEINKIPWSREVSLFNHLPGELTKTAQSLITRGGTEKKWLLAV